MSTQTYGSGGNTVVGWQMNMPFQEHVKLIWDEELKLYSKINDSASVMDKVKAIDDWYGILRALRSRLISYLGTGKEGRRLKRIMSDIREITQGKDMNGMPLEDKTIIKIRDKLEEFREILFEISGDNDLLLPKRKRTNPNEVW